MKLKIYSIKPCVEKNHLEARVKAEINNIGDAYNKLKKGFENIRISKIGAIRIGLKSANILIFDNGEIVINAADEETILNELKKINKLIG